MQRGDFIAFFARAVNGFLNGPFCGTPTDNADGGISITVPLRPRQFFGSDIELAETLLHHRHMIFWLIVWVSMFIVFESGSGVRMRSRSGRRNGGNAARGIGVASIFMSILSSTHMTVVLRIGGRAIDSIR